MKKLIMVLMVAGFVARIAHAQAQQQKISLVDSFMSSQFPDSVPGAVLLIVKDNEVILRKGYGLSSVEKNNTMKTDNIFRIGSITKQFTAMAILKLAEKKELDLNKDIRYYIGDLPEAFNNVTLRQLLTHTSGMMNYTSIPDFWLSREGRSKPHSRDEIISAVAAKPFAFTPGSRFSYNNSGYFLLGAVIEKVSGMSYEAFITKEFIKPLKLTSTTPGNSTSNKRTATGYEETNSGYERAVLAHPSVTWSAGEMYSSVDDLWKWNRAVFGGKVVGTKSLEIATQPAKLTTDESINYGYGFMLGQINGHKVIDHGGDTFGFLTYSMYMPEQNLYICLLLNSDRLNPGIISYQIASMVMGWSTDSPKALPLSSDKLQEYTGVYQASDSTTRSIKLKDGKLYSQRENGAELAIQPYETDKFFFEGQSLRLSFTRDDGGKINGMNMVSYQYLPQFHRRTNKPLSPEKQFVSLSKGQMELLVGRYEIASGFNLDVSLDDGALMIQPTGQSKVQLHAESNTLFYIKEVGAQVEFITSEDGKVSSLNLMQGGRAMPGKKIN